VRHSRRLVRLAVALAACLALGLGAWFGFIHSYFYDAPFMQAQSGSSTQTINVCTVGEAQYFGYPLAPSHSLRITGAELVGVPSTYTVEGVYAVNTDNGKYIMFGGGTQQDWTRMGYATAHLYPVTAVNLADGKWDGWWLVAKVVPHQPGLQTIQGIRISYKSGWRSGTVVFNEAAASTCTK
jgi:hypothetical protein